MIGRPGYRWVVGDLRTGKIHRTIDLPGGTWGTTIGDDGRLEGTHPLRGGEWVHARAEAAPVRGFLAVAYVDDADTEHWLAGGPIWTTRYDDATGNLAIGAAALSSYFDHRKVIPVLAAGQNPATVGVSYTGNQLGLIAKRLVELTQSHTGGSLPIVLPSDAALGGAGTKHERTWPGYELGWVGERLNQLREVEEGPEIQFVPRRRTDDPRFLEWVMRIGVSPSMLLAQAGAPHVFDRTVPESAVQNIDVATEGSGVSFRSWAAGEGEAEGRPIEYAQNLALVDAGWPLVESEVTGKDSVSERPTLQGYAREDLMLSARPRETWTVVVRRDAAPHVGRYGAGDWCVLRVRDHVYVPDGDHRMRVVSVAGGGDTVTLQMQPALGGV